MFFPTKELLYKSDRLVVFYEIAGNYLMGQGFFVMFFWLVSLFGSLYICLFHRFFVRFVCWLVMCLSIYLVDWL